MLQSMGSQRVKHVRATELNITSKPLRQKLAILKREIDKLKKVEIFLTLFPIEHMTLIFKNILMFLFFNWDIVTLQGFPASSVGKEYACSSGDPDSIPGLGRSPGEGKGYPLQYSGLENSMGFQLHGFTKSRT